MAEELNNPLFEDEREFLERKKQEYERALRGDVEHIKEQGVQVGKVAAVGAGLLGSVWLISKAFGGKSKRKSKKDKKKQDSYDDLITLSGHDNYGGHDYGSHEGERDTRYGFDDDHEFELDDEAFALDRSVEFGAAAADFSEADHYAQGGSPGSYSAAGESAQAFGAHDDQQLDAYDHNDDLDYHQDEADETDFNNGFGSPTPADLPQGRLDFGPAVHHHKQGYEPTTGPALAYDDSRRLPKSKEFAAQDASHSSPYAHDADVPWPSAPRGGSSTLGKRVGNMAMSFLGTDTGKAVAAQAAAVVLAYVSKKINDYLPRNATTKNADLADAPATTTFHAPPSPPFADSSPAVSLTLTDAPTEHPAS